MSSQLVVNPRSDVLMRRLVVASPNLKICGHGLAVGLVLQTYYAGIADGWMMEDVLFDLKGIDVFTT